MADKPDSARTVSKGHKYAMWFFTLLLTALFIWCGGFVLRDIDSIPRPDLGQFEKESVGQALFDQKDSLQTEIDDLSRAIQAKEEHRASLKQSTDESQTTMQQLLDIQQKSIESNIALSEEEREYFVESQQIFLANQQQLQTLIAEVQSLSSEKRDKEYALGKLNETIEEKKKSARDDYDRALKRRGRNILLLKLALVVPLLIVGAWLFTAKRTTRISNIVYAFDAAILWLLIRVIHEHFAFKYAKYIFLVSAIVVVIGILMYLVKVMLKPGKKWLMKKYEEAYREGKCPVCRYPIQQGKLRHMLAAKRAFRKATTVPVYEQSEPEPYTCPLCGSAVFDKCGNCGGIRHSMLEYCVHCGERKIVFDQPSN